MRDLALTAFFFALLPFVLLKRPHWGILIWTWIGLMSPQHLTYGFARSIPYALIVAVVTMVAMAISPEKKRLPLSGLVVTLLLFDLWMTVTTVPSIFPDLAWPYWELVIKIQLMVLLTIVMMQSKDRIKELVWVSTLSIAFFSVKGGIFTILRGGKVMIEGPGGMISENNSVAVAFTMTLPLMYWLYLQAERRWVRNCLMACLGLSVIGTLGTFSRGGILALTGMGIWLWFKSRKKVAITLFLVILVPIALSIMPDEWYARMGTIRTYEQNTSAMARINAWGFAVNLARDKPLTGGGFQVFQPDAFAIWGPDATQYGLSAEEWHDAHSIWFKVLAEQGVPGLALYLLLWYLAWRTAARIVKDTKPSPDLNWAGDLAAMIQVSLIAFWVGGSFLSFAYWDYPMVLVGLLVAMRAVLDRQAIADTATGEIRLEKSNCAGPPGQGIAGGSDSSPPRHQQMQP